MDKLSHIQNQEYSSTYGPAINIKHVVQKTKNEGANPNPYYSMPRWQLWTFSYKGRDSEGGTFKHFYIENEPIFNRQNSPKPHA